VKLPDRVRIIEVGPRDGLQNEPEAIPTASKVALINRLADAGVSWIEATSFVSPRAIPQLADSREVMTGITQHDGVRFPVLVPNERGYHDAVAAGATHVSVFTAASESFTQANINATIDASLERFAPIVRAAEADGVSVRGYVSTAWGCPFEGPISPSAVRDVCARLFDLGVSEVSLGDTIGVAIPGEIADVVGPVMDIATDPSRVALHLHDTRGTALANAWEGLRLGVTTFDASVSGLGGCPYAPGATGNLATEDLVWMLHRAGIATGINLAALIDVSRWIADLMQRTPAGHVAQSRIWPWNTP
jgi:hydroxymethylglutaryl-CoA lyase